MNYKFEYQLSENDYFEFNKYHLNNSTDSKMGLLLQKISLPITFIIILLFNIMQGIDKIQILIFFVVFTIASILWILTSKKTNERILKRYINFIKKHSKLPYSESAVMEFYDEYFIEKTQTTKSKIQYKARMKFLIAR